MRTRVFIFILCCSVIQSVAAQGFGFRDPAWVGFISTRSTSGNDPIFASATHIWHLEQSPGDGRTDSIGSITLSETGGTVGSGTGIHGNAANFNTPGRWLSLSTHIGQNVSQAYTYAVWVNFRTLPASGKFAAIFIELDFVDRYLWVDSSGNVTFNAGGGVENGGVDLSASLGSLNSWHLIVCGQVDNTGEGDVHSKLSVDGSVFVDVFDDQSQMGNGLLSIGGVEDVFLNCPAVPDAVIDEVVVWPTAPSQANVTTLYGGGTPTVFYSP